MKPFVQIGADIVSPKFDDTQYPFQGAHLVRLVGSGANGQVGLYQLTSGNIVAIKHVNNEFYSVYGLYSVVLLEISILQSLRGCENLLQLLNVELREGDVQPQIATISLMVTNHTSDLDTFIKTVPLAERLQSANGVIDQLLNGLYQLYHRGILHRDIKPSNIFMDYEYDPTNQSLVSAPHCYYGDFGSATQLACSPNDRHDLHDLEAYSLAYRPPEIMAGRKDYTEKADLWALGVTLVQYFSGELMFTADDNQLIQQGIFNDILSKLHQPPPIDQYPQYQDQIHQGTVHNYVALPITIPKDFRHLLEQLLQVNPDDRPSITTLVTNQIVCPYPPTLLPRGPLHHHTKIIPRHYYSLVDWLLNVGANKRYRPKTMIVCIDLIDRYLAHYHADTTDLQLIGLTLLLMAVSVIELHKTVSIDELVEYSNQEYTADQFRAKELEMFRQLNYTILSCETDRYIDRVERQAATLPMKYQQLRRMYKTIKSKRVYAGDLSYDQIMSYLD